MLFLDRLEYRSHSKGFINMYERAKILWRPVKTSGIPVVSVLVDSGADGNFIDADLVSQLHLPSIPLQTSWRLSPSLALH
ncbi:hypothetical protein SKAU_G00206770 [Synaphobranchus kaupii]|uniref:Peptidase A2 domain-containing protein n=1 Tax=Synaphobranchus kaupii TaxID=118154 RepID=A0A9Q1F881_SYNKA|nr:hypothetical protein SKAU_G00206770 [Synaphobranchus kaupii]